MREKPMKVRPSFSMPALALVASLALGCGSGKSDPIASGAAGEGSEGQGGGSSGPLPEGPLLPWAVGNSWTYQVTKGTTVSTKTTTIGDLEAVGGDGPNAELMAYHVTTGKGDSDHTESWQAPSPDNPERVVRYREQSFSATTGELATDTYWDPEKLHVDGSAERTIKAANWLESYAETKLTVGLTPTSHDVRERWMVLDDDETLTVPFGTFEHTIHFQKIGSSTSKEYWYLRGVGKLKETGSQTEELTDYHLQGGP
jgi:hypothetical protein